MPTITINSLQKREECSHVDVEISVDGNVQQMVLTVDDIMYALHNLNQDDLLKMYLCYIANQYNITDMDSLQSVVVGTSFKVA